VRDGYLLLSPVGDHRKMYLPRFIEAVMRLSPPPEEVVLCVDADSECFPPQPVSRQIRFLVNPAIEYSRGDLQRICSAREILRKFFIYHPRRFEYALWVDSDILIPPNTMETLKKVMEEENCLVVVNKYLGRNGNMWCGSGVMLTSLDACTASRFWVGITHDKNGVEKHLSEDFVFFSILDQGKVFLKQWCGKSGRTCGEYVKVEHLLGGREK
jgi:hypothetical protein